MSNSIDVLSCLVGLTYDENLAACCVLCVRVRVRACVRLCLGAGARVCVSVCASVRVQILGVVVDGGSGDDGGDGTRVRLRVRLCECASSGGLVVLRHERAVRRAHTSHSLFCLFPFSPPASQLLRRRPLRCRRRRSCCNSQTHTRLCVRACVSRRQCNRRARLSVCPSALRIPPPRLVRAERVSCRLAGWLAG